MAHLAGGAHGLNLDQVALYHQLALVRPLPTVRAALAPQRVHPLVADGLIRRF